MLFLLHSSLILLTALPPSQSIAIPTASSSVSGLFAATHSRNSSLNPSTNNPFTNDPGNSWSCHRLRIPCIRRWYHVTLSPSPCWRETSSVRALSANFGVLKAPEFGDRAQTELVSLRQGDRESGTLYHLRMQRILRRWQEHGLPGSLVKGLLVDGLREEFWDWVALKRSKTLEEAVGIAMDWEGAWAVRRMREEWRRKSIGRRSMCRCEKHQCWKKYERSENVVNAVEAEAAEAPSPVGVVSSAQRIDGMMMVIGVFFLSLLFLCLQY